MKVAGISRDNLDRIIELLGIKITDVHYSGKRVVYIHFKLKAATDKYRKIHEKIINGKGFYRGGSSRKRTSSLCSHGIYDFIKEVFKINKNAKIVSSTCKFKNEYDFLKNAERDFDYFSQIETGEEIIKMNGYYITRITCTCEDKEE